METQYSNKELQVEVIDVFPEKNSVWIENENASGEYEVQAPANIRWAKKGPATIKFNGVGQICYIRSNAPKQNTFNNYNKPFQQKTWNKTSTPAQPFQKANTYQPEEKEHYVSYVKTMKDVKLEEFEAVYNELSLSGKWIVASNLFPAGIRVDGGRYDCVIFIKEPKSEAEKALQITQEPSEKKENRIKEESMGVY